MNQDQTQKIVIEGELIEQRQQGELNTPPLSEQILETEEQEVARLKESEHKKYLLTPKYREWLRLFLDSNNAKTFGNATQSALQAYNLDPETDYWTAATIGKQNSKKHQNLAKAYLDKKGFTYGKFIDVILKKAITNKSNELLSYLREVGEFFDLPEIPAAAGIQAGNTTNYNTQINGINLEQLDDGQLRQYIESKRTRLAHAGSLSTPRTGETDPKQST